MSTNKKRNVRRRPSAASARHKGPKVRGHKVKKGFSIQMQKKLVVLYVFILLAFVGLSVRLAWLVREKGVQYQKQVFSQQRYDSITIPYRRGDIVDAKGTKLAISEKVYNLVIDAKVITTNVGGREAYLEPTLAALGENFDLDMTAVRQYILSHKTSSYYVPLKKLTYDQISGFQAAQAANSNIKGVWFEEEYKRTYPYGSLAADVLGFTNADGQGKYGLEEYYNSMLSGINGREYGYLNDDQTLERTVKSAVDGYNIHSTIDASIQMIVEKYLKKFNDDNKDAFTKGNGAENVGCIIMKVDSGEILAMASYPTFDLNDVRNPNALIGSRMIEQFTNANGYQENRKTATVIDEEVLVTLTAQGNEDKLNLNLYNLWKNYCITGTYEPGSTAKPFTVAAGLEEGVISADTTIECTGALEIGGHTIHCHDGTRGALTLERAVARSCNVAMMRIAQLLGKDAFCKNQQLFNFGLKTNIDLAGEARTASLIYTSDDMGPTDLATNSFGQNFNVTMIEMITGFCSLINGGYYYEPHMVNKITNANGATVENIEPRLLKQTVSESTSALIRQYCKAVVDTGTGITARPPGYSIGGKTGTAETIDPDTHKRSETEHVVSFIGYAPADDPQIAIYVVVDRVNAERQGDAKFATRLVRSILMEVLPYMNIFMTEELSQSEIEELNALQLEITRQYTEPPQEGEGEGNPGTSAPTGEGGQGADPGQVPPWMNYPIDPDTGCRVDPQTGQKYDAQTGLPVEDVPDTPDMGIPVNPNLP